MISYSIDIYMFASHEPLVVGRMDRGLVSSGEMAKLQDILVSD